MSWDLANEAGQPRVSASPSEGWGSAVLRCSNILEARETWCRAVIRRQEIVSWQEEHDMGRMWLLAMDEKLAANWQGAPNFRHAWQANSQQMHQP